MTRWEYRRTPLLDEAQMDGFGGNGWELVSVLQPIRGLHMHDTAPAAIMFWKRQDKAQGAQQ